MSEEQTPTPEWERMATEVENRLSQRLDQGLGDLAQRQELLAQQTAQAAAQAAAQARPPAPQPTGQAGQKILENFFADPERFFGDLGQIIDNKADERTAAQIRAYEERRQAEEGRNQFWNDFSAHNRDLADMLPMVEAIMQRMPGRTLSERADGAAAQLRSQLAQKRADAAEAERRQNDQANMTATGPATNAAPESGPQNDKPMTRKERLEAFMAKEKEEREARMTSPY